MHKQNGFSAVELIITLLVVGAGFAIIASTYSMSVGLSSGSRALLTANGIAYTKLQSYENKDFASIPSVPLPAEGQEAAPIQDFTSELPAQLRGPKQGQVFITSQSATLKYIFVRITFQSNSGQRALEYGSLVQAGGIGR